MAVEEGLVVGDDGQPQVLLGAEEVVEAPPVHPRSTRHHVEGGAVEALAVDEIRRRQDELLARALFFRSGRHRSMRHRSYLLGENIYRFS